MRTSATTSDTEGSVWVRIADSASDWTSRADALRKQGYELVESEITYVPSVESRPEDEDLKKLKKLVDMLEDNDDVQTVNTNCSVDLEEV